MHISSRPVDNHNDIATNHASVLPVLNQLIQLSVIFPASSLPSQVVSRLYPALGKRAITMSRHS